MKKFLLASAMLSAFAVSVPSGFAMVHGKAMTMTLVPTSNYHSDRTMVKHMSRRNLDGKVYATQARVNHGYSRPKSFATDKKSSSSSSATTSSTPSAMSSSAMSSSAMSSSTSSK